MKTAEQIQADMDEMDKEINEINLTRDISNNILGKNKAMSKYGKKRKAKK